MVKRKPAKRAAKEGPQEVPWQTTPADRQSTGIPGFDELVDMDMDDELDPLLGYG